jgi:Ser/Thr protein kinase RdoA (MazF antagonist)
LPPAPFDLLGPAEIVQAVESALSLRLDGTVTVYPSYINRVYGLRREDGGELVAKFYRPGRWSREAILEEHRFVRDCAEAELPVVAPLDLGGGGSLGELSLTDEEGERRMPAPEMPEIPFALYPKMGGRNFDAENGEDWLRLGSLVGRCHAAGALHPARHRPICSPALLTVPLAQGLLDEGLVHPKLEDEFADICSETLEAIVPLFRSISLGRIHGDCHRGNILDRPGEGLLLIDFDDMMLGPAVQDLWLLLPDRAGLCARELGLLVEGYERFSPFNHRELALIEPLRFMRMVYFLAWRSRQRGDAWFSREFPDWGNEAFWIREIEDLRDQAQVIREELAGEAALA